MNGNQRSLLGSSELGANCKVSAPGPKEGAREKVPGKRDVENDRTKPPSY